MPSQIFASIPIGSTVVVQWEDRGPWTHGTIVGKGDHNYHDWSYNTQITTTGRKITCNRQHSRLASIRTDDYIHYQATKHANRQIDPLDAILEHINNYLQSYSSRTVQNNSNNNHNIHHKQQAKNNRQGNGQEHMQKKKQKKKK